MKYDTRQKGAVLAFFKANKDRIYTAEEVLDAIPGAGRSSVYRIIAELCGRGLLMRSANKGRRQSWQYAESGSCREHMHIECEMCGKVEHLDMESTRKIREIISEATGFDALNVTVFNGICPDCGGEGR